MGAKWTGGVVDRHADDGPPTVEEWRPVAVPGEQTAFADATGPVAYRTTVADPRADESDRALLELRGTAARVEIWLNGIRIGEREPFVGSFRTAFDPRPENELIVVCERFDWRGGPDAPTGTDSSSGTIREGSGEHAAPGPRCDVSVEARPRTFCRSFEARPRFTDEGGVIDVDCEVDAGEAIDDAITFSLRPEGFRGSAAMQRVPVRAAAGERVTVSDSLEIREPSPWWPRGYGPPHRYTVRAKLGRDSVARTVGFCDVERDGDAFLVNGRPVRLRGFTRLPGGDPVADVERAAAANANLLRASGHVPPAAFYAACDEAGILVWQDLPTADPITGSSVTDSTAETAATDSSTGRSPVRDGTLAATLEDAVGHHPSLATYGVAAETNSPFDGLYGSGFLTKLRFRYRAWRTDVERDAADATAETVAETVAESTGESGSGTRPVVSRTGPPGTDPDAVLLSPGWQYLGAEDSEWLLDRNPSLGRLVAGFEAGSVTSEDVAPSEIRGLDASVLEHRVGTDPDRGESQAYQARTLQTVAEALRRHESNVLISSALRDVAPGGGMGILTHGGDEKPAYRALARAFEPVQAVLDEPPTPGSVGITLCNDTYRDLEATVAWSAGGAGGETSIGVGPLETTAAGTAEVPREASGIELSVRVDDRTIVNEYRL